MTIKRRFTDEEYAEMAADYEANPPTADEVLSIEINPASQSRPRGSRYDGAAVSPIPWVPIAYPISGGGPTLRRTGSSTVPETARGSPVAEVDR